MPVGSDLLEGGATLYDLLRAGIERDASAPALASSETEWSWAECDRLSSRWASHLLGLGLRPGDRVASLMPNRVALLLHYLGCWKAGLVVAPLNYRYTTREIDHALGVIGASLLVAHDERRSDLDQSAEAAGLSHGVTWFRDLAGAGTGLEDLCVAKASGTDFPRPTSDDPAAIFFTSGSTGLPKGVTHSFFTMGHILASGACAFEFTDRDVLMPASSMSHLGAFLFSFAALSRGAEVVVPHTSDGDEILPMLRRKRPTVLAMIPAPLLALVREHDATHDDFASLRLCRSGSDKVSAELEREFVSLAGFPIDEGYGMTEAGLVTLNPPSGPMRIGSIGTPSPGFELSVRDEEGREVETGVVGKLWIRSPTLTVGYWDNPEATAEIFDGDWMDTGDLMHADAEGYFWFFGRKKQIIVHDGSNISPQEVEEALAEHPAVALSGVIGVRDSVHGENVRAYVALEGGRPRPTSQELVRFARARVGYKAPEEIVFLPEIPLNPTGKVDRAALKRQAAHHLDAHVHD